MAEKMPIGMRELLPSHEVYSAGYAGFAGISNGEMIRRERSGIGFVLIPHNDLDRIRPYADELR